MAPVAPTTVTPPAAHNPPGPVTQPRIPEPTTLYCLVVVALVTHVPYPNTTTCLQCQTAWPCEQVRLAFRLREAF
jgi:hypothetical protein